MYHGGFRQPLDVADEPRRDAESIGDLSLASG